MVTRNSSKRAVYGVYEAEVKGEQNPRDLKDQLPFCAVAHILNWTQNRDEWRCGHGGAPTPDGGTPAGHHLGDSPRCQPCNCFQIGSKCDDQSTAVDVLACWRRMTRTGGDQLVGTVDPVTNLKAR